MESISIQYTRGELLARHGFYSMGILLGIVLLFFSVILFITKGWIGLAMVAFCVLWLWNWRKSTFLLLEITEDTIRYKYLLWDRTLSLRNICSIRSVTYDEIAPCYKGTEEWEDIMIKTYSGWLRRIFFESVPTKHGAGKFLIQRIRAVNPDAVIDIW